MNEGCGQARAAYNCPWCLNQRCLAPVVRGKACRGNGVGVDHEAGQGGSRIVRNVQFGHGQGVDGEHVAVRLSPGGGQTPPRGKLPYSLRIWRAPVGRVVLPAVPALACSLGGGGGQVDDHPVPPAAATGGIGVVHRQCQALRARRAPLQRRVGDSLRPVQPKLLNSNSAGWCCWLGCRGRLNEIGHSVSLASRAAEYARTLVVKKGAARGCA